MRMSTLQQALDCPAQTFCSNSQCTGPVLELKAPASHQTLMHSVCLPMGCAEALAADLICNSMGHLSVGWISGLFSVSHTVIAACQVVDAAECMHTNMHDLDN